VAPSELGGCDRRTGCFPFWHRPDRYEAAEMAIRPVRKASYSPRHRLHRYLRALPDANGSPDPTIAPGNDQAARCHHVPVTECHHVPVSTLQPKRVSEG